MKVLRAVEITRVNTTRLESFSRTACPPSLHANIAESEPAQSPLCKICQSPLEAVAIKLKIKVSAFVFADKRRKSYLFHELQGR
jgi:hypothetical protein